MIRMFTSASRVVLLIITVTLCTAVLTHIIEAKDFLILAGMVFAFYFNKNQGNAGDEEIK